MEAQILSFAYATIAGLLSMLVLLIGWIGKSTMQKIDKLNDSIDCLNIDLHERLNGHDKRITWTEVYIEQLKNKGASNANVARSAKRANS